VKKEKERKYFNGIGEINENRGNYTSVMYKIFHSCNYIFDYKDDLETTCRNEEQSH